MNDFLMNSLAADRIDGLHAEVDRHRLARAAQPKQQRSRAAERRTSEQMHVSQRRWGSGHVRGPSDAKLTVGSTLAYRARQGDELAEVQIIRVGIRKPRRVLVTFVDDDLEGLEEWVPLARLKVRLGRAR